MHKRSPRTDKTQLFYEVTCNEGLERFVQRELRRLCGKDHQLSSVREAGEVLFSYSGEWKKLRALETADDLFRVLSFAVPRPRGILEPLKLRELTNLISKLTPAVGGKPLRTFRFSAAGADSKELLRIRQTIASATGLTEDQEDGELLIRLRRSKVIKDGWDVLVRLTRRPLHVREWRTADYRGALSAPIARVMVELLDADASDTFLDPMCGSGTILIEQLRYRPVKSAFGIEVSEKVLEHAQKNLKGIKTKTPVELAIGDATALPFKNSSIGAIACNPPWGEAIRDREGLPELYHKLLGELLRVLKPGGKLCLIVQDTVALDAAVLKNGKSFELLEKHSALQRKGFHPTIFLFKKR